MDVSPVRRPYGLAHIHACELAPLGKSTSLTHLQNPLSYEGDSLRTVPQLQHLEYAATITLLSSAAPNHAHSTFPLLEIARLLSLDTLDLEPTDIARQAFEYATGINFDPPLVTTTNDLVEISCPACEKLTCFTGHGSLKARVAGHNARSTVTAPPAISILIMRHVGTQFWVQSAYMLPPPPDRPTA